MYLDQSISITMLKYDIKAKHLNVKGKKYILFAVLPISDTSSRGVSIAKRNARRKAKKKREEDGCCVRVYSRPRANHPHIRLYIHR